MKLFFLFSLIVSSFTATAAEVLSAKLDDSQENLLVDVRYGGGCKKHNFSLNVGACAETFPVRCTAELVETVEGGFDGCEALIHQTVKISLKSAGLDEHYYDRASLTILGDKDYNGVQSKASVKLP